MPKHGEATASGEYAPVHGLPAEVTSEENTFTLGRRPGYLYEEMADHLALRIEQGDLRADETLPSERELALQYKVSLGTARHATRLLRGRGLVKTVRSKGHYIVPQSNRGRQQ